MTYVGMVMDCREVQEANVKFDICVRLVGRDTLLRALFLLNAYCER